MDIFATRHRAFSYPFICVGNFYLYNFIILIKLNKCILVYYIKQAHLLPHLYI